MPEQLCRAEPAGLVTRAAAGSLLTRAENGERIVEGIGAPWGETIEFDGQLERFDRGCFDAASGVGAAFYGVHSHLTGGLPVGLVVASENRDEGQWFQVRISETPAGDELLTLIRDKVITGLSVGMRLISTRLDGDVTVYTESELIELSGVPRPAYKTARVSAVRTEDRPAPPTPEGNTVDPEELARLQAALTDLQTRSDEQQRQISVLTDRGGTGGSQPVPAKYRSLGAVVKALAPAKGQARAISDEELSELHRAYDEAMETRAYTGATTTDLGSTLKPAWIERDVKVISENRRIFDLFASERLPAEGMSVEFPKFGTKTGDVAKQAAQGDDLTYIEIDLTTDTANVETFGAFSQLTRQAIERGSVPYLNKVLQVQRISYGKVTNSSVRTTLTGYTGTNTDTLPFADRGKAPAWEERVLQAAADFESNSITGPPSAWVMGLTQFKQAALLTDTTGRPIFSVSGQPVNSIGTTDLLNLRLNIGGLPAFLDPGLAGNYSYIASKEAITTLESGPFNLTDENIVNLSKAFSLYGYLAITKNDAKGITKINHPAA